MDSLDEELIELYQEMILDHKKSPRNFRAMDPSTHDAYGHNPLCGDKLRVFLNIQDGVVEDASFQGEGCAISTASASILTETVKGKTLDEAEAIFGAFTGLVTGKGDGGDVALGKLAAFAGVRAFPMRVKCATLPWHTLKAAADGGDTAKTE